MRIMALDVGEKRIGVAVSDELMMTAQGLCVIETKGVAKDLASIADLATKNGVTHLVLGLPKNMDGTSGSMVEKVRDFGRLLQEKLPGITLAYWDERMTTAAVQRMLVEADVSRKRRRQVVDKLAAVLILQGYMDFIARQS